MFVEIALDSNNGKEIRMHILFILVGVLYALVIGGQMLSYAMAVKKTERVEFEKKAVNLNLMNPQKLTGHIS